MKTLVRLRLLIPNHILIKEGFRTEWAADMKRVAFANLRVLTVSHPAALAGHWLGKRLTCCCRRL